MTSNQPTITPATPPSSITGPKHKVFLFTHVRTASNLFLRILNLDAQPALLPNAKREYYFLPATSLKFARLPGRYADRWTDEEWTLVKQTYQQCFEAMEAHVNHAEANSKHVFIKEHAAWLVQPTLEADFATRTTAEIVPERKETTDGQLWMVDAPSFGQTRSASNETIFSDKYLLSWRATFLIRHPALVFPSLYRTSRDLSGQDAVKTDPRHAVEMTFKWLRRLYDFYTERCSNTDSDTGFPIVVDAADVINSPDVMHKYCQATGLDPACLKFEWNVTGEDERTKMHFVERRMRSTLSDSTGLLKDKTSTNVDLDEEFEKWDSEFGKDEALKMRRWVEDALPDYEYMKNQRLR